MFSVENFYHILYDNIFNKLNICLVYFYPFGSIRREDLVDLPGSRMKYSNLIYFQDQEPITEESVKTFNKFLDSYGGKSTQIKIFCSSEKSSKVNQLCKENKFYHLYYFFHGFAALDWYRDAKYFPDVVNPLMYPYMSLNRLCTKERSYRLYLVSELMEQDLQQKGMVSLHFKAKQNLVKNEVFDPSSRLSKNAKKLIVKHLYNKNENLVADHDNITGEHSSHFGFKELAFWQRSLFHIVSETVFYEEKLHLTEKIFKPIVAKRPFILVGAYKNLEYLKSYGFKTFDRWIDESYDSEKDPDKRIQMIVKEIGKISKLNSNDLHDLKNDMQEILDFNLNHFFNDFKNIIINEFVDNLQSCFNQYNNGRTDDRSVDFPLEFQQKIKLLLQ